MHVRSLMYAKYAKYGARSNTGLQELPYHWVSYIVLT